MFNNRPIRQKLIAAFLVLSVLPLALVAKFMLDFHINSLEEQSLNQLVAVRNIKRQQLTQYFQGLDKQARYFVGNASKGEMSLFSNPVLLALSEFETGLSELANDQNQARQKLQSLFVAKSGNTLQAHGLRGYYLDAHNDLHPKFNAFVENFSYHDLFLVNPLGDIIYTVKKDRQLGHNLTNGTLANSTLASAFVKAKLNGIKQPMDIRPQAYFSDFELDDISGLDSAFVSVPLFDKGDLSAVIIYQMSKDDLNNIMAQQAGLGRTGETFLVGPDHTLRTDVQQVASSDKLTTAPVINALNGVNSQGLAYSYSGEPVLNATMSVKVFDQTWALVTQITTDEAYAAIRRLSHQLMVLGLVFIALIVLVALMISATLSRPIVGLSKIAEKMATGELDQQIPLGGLDELGRLSKSFAAMRDAIQHKIVEVERQNEALKTLDKAKDDLLANTSHELRTPLAGIIGLSESLFDHLAPAQHRTLEHVIASGRHLATLVNDILDTASLRNKQVKINLSSLNLRKLVDQDFSINAHLLKDKNISLQNQVEPDICVQGDPHRLQQVLQNLLGNAIKFTDNGFINVTAKRVDERIEVSVQDSGEGIAKAHQQRVFEAFEQGDGSSTRAQGGTGLGLSITSQLVELHGGQLKVESQLGQGSTFTFTLPISHETAQNSQVLVPKLYDNPKITTTLSQQDPIAVDSGDDFNILVVDDEPINLQIVLNHLSKSGCNVTLCDSGTQALAQIEQQKPDLVLLDVMMPNLDGYQTCRQIRQQYSTYQLPIIFLTARNQLKDLVEAFACGGNDYLSKPFFKDELLARVQVQIQLLMQKRRMNTLRQLANNISQYKSHEDMIKATFEFLKPDPLINAAHLFCEGQLVDDHLLRKAEKDADDNSLEDIKSHYPEEIFGDKNDSEMLAHVDDDTLMYSRLSNEYVMATKFPTSSSEDWIRNLTQQTRLSMEQIRRIFADPKTSLIQSQIKAKLNDILYLKVDDNYCLVFIERDGHLKEEVHRVSFKQVLMYLDKNELYQINRSIAVNPHKVSRYNKSKKELVMNGEHPLPVAKRYIALIKQDMPQLF